MNNYMKWVSLHGIFRLHIVSATLGIIACFLLSACNSSSTNAVTVTGLVGDDPIIGANVTLISAPEDDEAGTGIVLGTAVTNSAGQYTLSVVPPPPYRITISGGTMNGTPFPGVLTGYCTDAGRCNATPYTSAMDDLMVYEGMNVFQATHDLAHALNVDYDPFIYEQQTGQTVPASRFNLAAARSVLTTKDAISNWIWELATYSEGLVDAPVPPGVKPPLLVAVNSSVLRKGPYLMLTGKNTEMKVMWQGYAENPISDVELLWGESKSAMTPVSVAPGTDVLYQQTITGLTPNTLYNYKLRYKALSKAIPPVLTHYSSSSRFRTPPAENATEVTFYAYGDTRSNAAIHNNVVKGMTEDMQKSAARQSFSIHVGDFVLRGHSEKYWDALYFSRDAKYAATQEFLATFPISAAVGNHEFWGDTANPKVSDNHCGRTNNGDIFRKYWPSSLYHTVSSGNTTYYNYYYSFDYGPVHFAVIDPYTSSIFHSDDAQFKWLEDDLAKSQKPWKIVVTHVPLYDASGSNADAGCGLVDFGKQLRQSLHPLLQKYGVQLVLQGHQHYYSRSTLKNFSNGNSITYIVTGGGGAPLQTPHMYKLPFESYSSKIGQIFQFLRIDVKGTEMKVFVYQVNGADSSTNIISNKLYDEIPIQLDGSVPFPPDFM